MLVQLNLISSRLARTIRIELRLYQSVLKNIAQERSALENLDLNLVTSLAADRQSMVEEIERNAQQRRQLEIQLARWSERDVDASSSTLTNIVEQCSPTAYRAILVSLVKQLKNLIAQTRREAQDLESVLGFSLQVVSGEASIFGSAFRDRPSRYGPDADRVGSNYRPSSSSHFGMTVKEA